MSKWFEWRIDFEGQKLSEIISQVTIVLFAVIGFVYGFLNQDLLATMYIYFGGIIFTSILTLPPWPIYNKHPVQWLPEISEKDVK
ncbi:microsomal signal peptidase 12kDa subunit [Gigaspora rosea]|uniref:Signal peptidase complex subunit 1 n=1 Tax=Gigaspora rosea TaxID=44941 RepID=A0A397TZU0_9GLOM|nr:microsomal signal peptidase 12kDa subunit [Gigaspora rosea]